MTNKELLYLEDALGHETFMKTCSMNASKQITDANLATYMQELSQKHTDLLNKFLNVL